MARKTADRARPGIGLISLAAAGGFALVAGIAALVARRAADPAPEGHAPTDLEGDTHPGFEDRATPDFRPDPTAPVAAADREAFRPATLAVPFPNDVTVERAPA